MLRQPPRPSWGQRAEMGSATPLRGLAWKGKEGCGARPSSAAMRCAYRSARSNCRASTAPAAPEHRALHRTRHQGPWIVRAFSELRQDLGADAADGGLPGDCARIDGVLIDLSPLLSGARGDTVLV